MEPKLLSVKFVGNINNTVPWRQSIVPTVSKELLEKHKYQYRMEIFQDDCIGTAYYSNNLSIIANIKKGYAFNGADVPEFADWLIPYNCYPMKAGAFFHDPAFNLKRLGQDVSAKVLSDVAHYEGLPKWKARLVNRCVSGRIAKRLYEDRDDFDLENSKFCSIRVIK